MAASNLFPFMEQNTSFNNVSLKKIWPNSVSMFYDFINKLFIQT